MMAALCRLPSMTAAKRLIHFRCIATSSLYLDAAGNGVGNFGSPVPSTAQQNRQRHGYAQTNTSEHADGQLRVTQSLRSQEDAMLSPPGSLNAKTRKDLRERVKSFAKRGTRSTAKLAQDVLQRLAAEADVTGESEVDTSHYNLVFHAWANDGSFRQACELLDSMLVRHETNPSLAPAPDISSFEAVLHACAKSPHPQAVIKAEDLIRRFEQLSFAGPKAPQPTTKTYNIVILAHANRSKSTYGAPSDAEDWLRYLSKRHTEGGPGPNSVSFNTVLRAWRDCPEESGADRALQLLELMMKLHGEGHEEIFPDEISFGTVIDAYARRKRPEEAEEILQLALKFLLVNRHSSDLTICFNCAIHAWAKSGEHSAPERALALLDEMQELYHEAGSYSLKVEPDIHSIVGCVEAIVNSGQPDASEIADRKLWEVLQNAGARARVGKRSIQPNRWFFECVIRAWLESEKPDRLERAERILDAMLNTGEARQSVKPGVKVVNLFISAWCSNLEPMEALEKSMKLIDTVGRLQSTDWYSYKALLDMLTNVDSHKAIFGAVDVLQKFEQQVASGNLQWSSNPEALYNDVIFALARVGNMAAADKAVSLLDGMKTNRKRNARPTILTYTGVLLVLSKVAEQERVRGLRIIYELLSPQISSKNKRVRLNTRAFQAMLSFLDKARKPWTSECSLLIWDAMTTMFKENDQRVQPDSAMYDSCLLIMARSDVEAAVERLEILVKDWLEGNASDLPSPRGFAVLYDRCQHLKTEQSTQIAQRVKSLFEQMESEGHLSGGR